MLAWIASLGIIGAQESGSDAALTPMMGYLAAAGCNTPKSTLQAAANTLIDLGLAQEGYNYLVGSPLPYDTSLL